MAISFGKKKQSEEQFIDSDQIEDGEVVDSSEEEQEDIDSIIEKKKKQQRMIIFISAGVGVVAMMGYWFLTNNAANHSVTARVAQQTTVSPSASPQNPQAAIIAAQQKADEEAMAALGESVGAAGATQNGTGDAGQGGRVMEPPTPPTMVSSAQGGIQGQNMGGVQGINSNVGVDSGKIGAPAVRVDQGDIVGKIDAMRQFLGESFSTLTSVINKNQTELVSKLDDISKKIGDGKKESGSKAESHSAAKNTTERVAEERSVPQVRVSSSWRLSRVEGEYAIIVSKSDEYVAVRKGDAVPGIGRVSEVSPERVVAGGVEIRKG